MRSLLRSLTALAIALAAAPALALDVGEKAPDLDVSEWFGGEPVVLADVVGKKVVVIEFWATFCEPCKKAIPRLSRLRAKHAAAGLEIVTISDEKPDVIKAFLKDANIKYHVACDELRNTFGPYMKGVRNSGHAPYAYVLDKTGSVAWRGTPSTSMDRIVERVLAGKLDAEKAKVTAELQTIVSDSYDHKDFAEAAADADKLLEADPANEKGILAKLRNFAATKEPAKSKEFVEKLLPLIDDDFVALNLVAWELATADNLAMRQPGPALKAARRAVELSEGKEAAVLDTLARAQFETGMIEQAIETATKAAAAEGADDTIKAALEYYKACAEARQPAATK